MRMRIKDFTTKVGSGVTPRGGAAVYQESGIPLFRSQNITNDGLLTDDIAYISEEIHDSMSCSQLKPNDVLLNITGTSIGRCYYLPEEFTEGNVNQHVCIIRLKKNVLPAFLYYNLISETGQHLIDSCQTGANREGLTKEDLCNFEFEIPSIERQKEIVAYLNERIALVTRQVSLLTSKRDAYLRLKKSIINRAVTKGLNPNVKMKDSGVDWIGEVPEGWEVKRIKEIGNLRLGKMLTERPIPGFHQRPYLKSKNIDWLNLKLDYVEEMYFSDSELTNLRLNKNDLVISEGGEVGKTAIWNNEIQECYIQNSVHKLTFGHNCNPRYYLYLFYNLGHVGYFKSIVNLVSIMHLTYEKLRRIEVSVPELEEQNKIATYLDDKCSKIDLIISNLDKQISKYGELKRSLIDEVITGKRAV